MQPIHEGAGARWLLLIHQVPTKPDYLRVKVRRRLQRLGAVAVKSAVYALPHIDGAVEDFEWLRREIVADGGEALLCAASLLDGLTDAELEALFWRDRDADYAEIAAAAAQLVPGAGDRPQAGDALPAEFARLQRRLDEVALIDYFGAPGRAAAETALAAAEARLRPPPPSVAAPEPGLGERVIGRTWVTRRGVGVDRIASAWLVRRFVDPAAAFRFVDPVGYRPARGELRFDMYEAEYTHEGPRCTFETLLARFRLAGDPALVALGEIVHDIDLKETTFARSETAGVAAMIAGIAATTPDDDARLERGAALFDVLRAAFTGRGAAS